MKISKTTQSSFLSLHYGFFKSDWLSLFQPHKVSGERYYANQSLEVCHEEARTFSPFKRFFLLILSCGAEKKVEVVEDIVQAAPEKAKLIFENDYVKAALFDLKPGDKLPLHTGGPRIIYSLTDYKLKWSEGGQESEKEWKKAEAQWHEADNHAVENTGETDAVYLVVARKNAALPAAEGYDLSKDASQLDSDHAGALFENDHVRLLEVQLQMAEKQPLHHGLPRLVYALTSYNIKYSSDRAEEKETAIEAGTAHWHNADEHSVENIGETLAHYLIFEFKK